MNSRTPLLIGVMGIVIAAWAADQVGMLEFIDQWGKQGDAALAKVTKDIETVEDLVMRGVDAGDRLEIYEQMSLPFNVEIARSRYQDWLHDLVEQNSLRQSTVEVGMPASVTVKDGDKKREAFKRYAFTVSAVGSLEQVTSFLYDFYRAGYLHKLNTVSFSKAGGQQFNMSIAGEALGIATCLRERELPTVTANRLAKSDFDAYEGIVRRNIFSREVGATLKMVSLTSVTYDKSGMPEAWFKVGKARATKKTQRGVKFSVSIHEIEVIDIQPRSVLLLVDGAVTEIMLGQSLADAMEMPAGA